MKSRLVQLKYIVAPTDLLVVRCDLLVRRKFAPDQETIGHPHLATDQDMIAAWEAAGRELGIRVRTPAIVDGKIFPVLVEEFGSPKGALPLLLGDDARHGIDERYGIGTRAGYFVSLLNPQTYCTFNRKHFEETLNDWQWFGKGPPPEWYTGEAWG